MTGDCICHPMSIIRNSKQTVASHQATLIAADPVLLAHPTIIHVVQEFQNGVYGV